MLTTYIKWIGETKMEVIAENYFLKNRDTIYKMIKHCLTNVPFYMTHWQFQLPEIADFDYTYFSHTIPILEKTFVRDMGDLFLSNRADKSDLTVEATSGSEGQPIQCYKSKSELIGYSMDLWFMRRKLVRDLTPKDKFAHFYLSRRKNGQVITHPILYQNNILNLSLFDISVDMLKNYWNEILKFQPRWLHGVTSTVYSLALVVKENNLPRYQFDLVEVTGEYLDWEKRLLIEEVFNCKIANLYGAREFWLLAYGCHHGNFHVNNRSVFIESVFNEQYNNYELLITSLKNDSWPLIRYRIGDLGILKKNECRCNIENPYILDLHRGRASDYCQINDVRFSIALFSFTARKINEKANKNIIKQHQVIKMDSEHLQINIVGDKNCKDFIEKEYKTELEKIAGTVHLNIQFTDNIPPDHQTGKVKEYIELLGV